MEEKNYFLSVVIFSVPSNEAAKNVSMPFSLHGISTVTNNKQQQMNNIDEFVNNDGYTQNVYTKFRVQKKKKEMPTTYCSFYILNVNKYWHKQSIDSKIEFLIVKYTNVIYVKHFNSYLCDVCEL